MLNVFQVWRVENGEVKSEKEMTFEEKTQIDETDTNLRNDKFFGWNIELLDLTGVLPLQVKFVSYKYTQKATKNMNTPQEFLLAGLVHKAVRRAMNEFAVPSDRDFDIIVEPLTSSSQVDNSDAIEANIEKPLTHKTRPTKVNLDDV